MNGEIRNLSDLPFEIPMDLLLSRIGFDSTGELSPRVQKSVKEAHRAVRDLAKPRAVYRTFPVRTQGRFSYINGVVRIKSRRLTGVLDPCERAAVFVITLGPEMDEAIQNNQRHRMHYGLVLDVAASVAVESAAEYLQHSIERRLPENFETTLRYSPGYCDCPLAEQAKLFHVLPDEPAGVNLSRDFLMLPRKSISGIIGIGASESVVECKNACADCPRTNCPHRRE